jgi:hypothetical protein
VPNLESDQEAQAFNLGISDLTLSAFSGDVFPGANASDYLVGTPFDTPACSTSTPISPGQGCFFDVALTPSNPVAAGLLAPPTYGVVWNSAITSHGDFVIADFQNAAVYRYPPSGAAPNTVITSGAPFPGGVYANNGIAIDPWNILLKLYTLACLAAPSLTLATDGRAAGHEQQVIRLRLR